MKKFLLFFIILPLILLTAFIKNSTKRIDDQIYATKEDIRILKKDYEENKLEYDYLSSSEKLLEFHRLYFDDELLKKNINQINTLKKINNNFYIENLKINQNK
tara:strand:+ start:201 stop:509 length:309 start_codon:yes stop_codon:yes gene_type:complete